VLAETTVGAANIEEAIRHAGDAEWPPGAQSLRLVDLDGQQVYGSSRPAAAEPIARGDRMQAEP
jgi:hypothetical protein